ncbi:hypothetical protein OF83DRAFT_1169785 [Amylostereum chailletii]|nr:hypothetical protein OF83DRAFT_1169785 [Amylostereum chailletii]
MAMKASLALILFLPTTFPSSFLASGISAIVFKHHALFESENAIRVCSMESTPPLERNNNLLSPPGCTHFPPGIHEDYSTRGPRYGEFVVTHLPRRAAANLAGSFRASSPPRGSEGSALQPIDSPRRDTSISMATREDGMYKASTAAVVIVSSTASHTIRFSLPRLSDMDRTTLVDEIARSKDPNHGEGFPVTELSKTLLYHVGVQATKRKYNQQVMYHTVEGLRDIYDEINPVIRRLGQLDLAFPDSDAEKKCWDDFTGYHKAIATSESALFDLLDPYDASDRTLPDDPEKWEEEFDRWLEFIARLPKGGRFTVERREEITKVIIDEARITFTSVKVEITSWDVRFAPFLGGDTTIYSGITDLLEKLRHGLRHAGKFVVVHAVKAVIALRRMIKNLVTGVAKQTIDKTMSALQALSKFFTALNEKVAEHDSDKLLKHLKKTYDDLGIGSLDKDVDFELPVSYRQLIQKAPRVRWPFYSRSHALALLCHSLVDTYEGSGRKKPQDIESLKTAFDKSITVVDKAIETYKTITFASVLWEVRQVASGAVRCHQVAFRTIEQIGKCYTRVSATKKWNDLKASILKEATDKDKENLKSYKGKLMQHVNSAHEEEDVNVDVTVHKSLESKEHIVSFTSRVTRSTYIGAIRWSAYRHHSVQGRSERDRVKEASVFNRDGSPLSLDKTVKDLGDGSMTLKIVLADPEA